MARIADIDRTASGKGLRRAAAAGRHHAVEHIDPAQNRADNVIRTADAHQITRFVLRQHSGRIVQNLKHGFLPLADGQTADGIAVKADILQLFGRPTAQIFIIAALLNAEDTVTVAVNKGFAAAFGPAHGHFDRFFNRFVRSRQFNTFVQTHGNV